MRLLVLLSTNHLVGVLQLSMKARDEITCSTQERAFWEYLSC